MYALMSVMITCPLVYISIPFVLFLYSTNKRCKAAFSLLSVSFLFIFTSTSCLKYAEENWYETYDYPLDSVKVYDYGIVLGGYSVWDFDRNRPEFSESCDRLYEGIRFYKTGKIKKLVLASDGSIIQQKDGDGLQGNPEGMMRYLNELGIPKEDILMKIYANNTHENITFTKELLGDSLRSSSILLITSGTHMRRSLRTFQQERLSPDCYIADTWVNVKVVPVTWWPSLNTLCKWSGLLHEWIGYAVY